MAVTADSLTSLDNRGVSLMCFNMMKCFIEVWDDLGAARASGAVMLQFRRGKLSKDFDAKRMS